MISWRTHGPGLAAFARPFPQVLWALFGLALLLGGGGLDRAEAEEPTRAGAAATPQLSINELESEAATAFGQGQFLQAASLYEQLLARADSADRARYYRRELVEIYHALRQHERAIRVGDALIAELQKLQTPSEPDRADLGRLQYLVGQHYLWLRHYAKAESLLRAALAGTGLSVIQQIEARVLLAQAQTTIAAAPETEALWAKALADCAQLARENDHLLSPRDRVGAVRYQARCLAALGRPQEADATLQAALGELATTDPALAEIRRDLLTDLTQAAFRQQDYQAAEAYLRQALALHDSGEGSADHDRMLAEMQTAMGAILRAQQREPEALAFWTKAATYYTQVLENYSDVGYDAVEAVDAFWKIDALYRRTEQLDKALDLLVRQQEFWTSDIPLAYDIQNAQGALQTIGGSLEKAGDVLRKVIAFRRQQQPIDLEAFPRALNTLAILEQQRGNLTEAQTLCAEVLRLYSFHQLPVDGLLVQTYGVLGAARAAGGDYVTAVEVLRKGLAVSEPMGAFAGGQRCQLLLTLAMTYKSQGDLDLALAACREAETEYRRWPRGEPRSPTVAAMQAAVATLALAQFAYPVAEQSAREALAICEEQALKDNVIVATAEHCLAVCHARRGEYAKAASLWQRTLEAQKKIGFRAVLARTLNHLAGCAESQKQPKAAEEYYLQAAAIHRETVTMPVEHFVTLWRLSALANQRGDRATAVTHLQEAIAVAERARRETYGAEASRARYFSQFSAAFDLMVRWSLEKGDYATALAAVLQSRNRTFLDQLQQTGLDPIASLRGTDKEHLIHQEADLRQEIQGLRARANSIAFRKENLAEIERLSTELKARQTAYADLWREIRNADPAQRELLEFDRETWALDAIRAKLGSDRQMLVYYLGDQEGFVLHLGPDPAKDRVYSLRVSAEALEAASELYSAPAYADAGPNRGIGRQALPKPAAPAAAAAKTPVVAVSRPVADILVGAYHEQLRQPTFKLRGIGRTEINGKAVAAASVVEQLGDAILPSQLRARLAQDPPRCLWVIPDGALHRLPMEGLVLPTAQGTPAYGLDLLPPIAYASSATVMATLQERARSRPGSAAPFQVLAVGDPEYDGTAVLAPGSQVVTSREQQDAQPRAGDAAPAPPPANLAAQPPQEPAANAAPARNTEREVEVILGFSGQLPRLPATATECRQLIQLLPAGQGTLLLREDALESKVRKHLEQSAIVHFAAHGFVDELSGNLFGALALTKPKAAIPAGPVGPAAAAWSSDIDDDGFLSIYEIYRHRLPRCRLAVLSACTTNVGPGRALEGGVTLASAFLAAGAERVIASHWPVADESTATLMEHFYQTVIPPMQRGESVDVAAAFRQAQRSLRESDRFAAPYFWAPFILIGPDLIEPAAATAEEVAGGADALPVAPPVRLAGPK